MDPLSDSLKWLFAVLVSFYMGTGVCPEANTLLLPWQGYEKEVEGKSGRVREHE